MESLFREELDGQKFASVEEYNAEVLRISRDLQEDLGKAERYLLSEEGRKEFLEEEEEERKP